MLMQFDGGVTSPDRLLREARDEIGTAVAQQARIGRNALPACPAEQAMKRHALRLADEVPQRDVDAAEREADRAVPPHGVKLALQIRHERRHVGDLSPDAQRRHHARESFARQRRCCKAEGLAPSDQSCVGVDPNEQRLHVRPRAERSHRLGSAMFVGHGDKDWFNLGNLHCVPRLSSLAG